MELNLFAIHAGILVSAFLFAYVWHMKTLRIKASFNLYRVRDSFIILVASDLLTEDDEVFKNYYNRINALLQTAPNVGIDDILHAMFRTYKTPEEFHKAVESAKQKAKKLQESPSLQNDAVKDAVANYYRAVNMMILSHSSIVKISYILSKKFMHDHLLCYLPPSRWKRGLDAIKFAEYEERAVTA